MTEADYKGYFEGKQVTVMGLGLLGRGVGDAAFLAECGAQVTVTDLKTKEELAASVALLADYRNISFVLGEHRTEDFENKDMILVAAGVPKDSPYLAHAQKSGVPLEMSAALFMRISKVPIVGVTGTRGKSTVSHMIHHVLSYLTGERVILGGNVRGVSNLQLLKEVKEDSLAVFELDSWQLQGFGWAKQSPQIAVFTNFMQDHLNYYKNDLDDYFSDKANIFLYQEDHDTFITTPDVFERIKKLPRAALGQEVVLADVSVLPDELELRVKGEHNRLNAALAYEALKAMSLKHEEIIDGLATFPGVPGRLEYVREVEGFSIYNDNNATTPEATVAGIKALRTEGEKNIVLILGGADKNVDLHELAAVIKKSCKAVVLLPGSGSDRIRSMIDAVSVDTLNDAVTQALDIADSGDTVLFSPAFASFGMFKNEYERNDSFIEIVNNR